jgi:FixJ family two-component response regulator
MRSGACSTRGSSQLRKPASGEQPLATIDTFLNFLSFWKHVMPQRPLVAVIDDDESVRESLPGLLKVLGFAARAFASAEGFLASDCIADVRCLILDVNMPRTSGPELQRELIRNGYAIPTIFITALSPQSIPEDLLEQGAVKCLLKPFSREDMRAALGAALTRA